jgi:hypothetical protein
MVLQAPNARLQVLIILLGFGVTHRRFYSFTAGQILKLLAKTRFSPVSIVRSY